MIPYRHRAVCYHHPHTLLVAFWSPCSWSSARHLLWGSQDSPANLRLRAEPARSHGFPHSLHRSPSESHADMPTDATPEPGRWASKVPSYRALVCSSVHELSDVMPQPSQTASCLTICCLLAPDLALCCSCRFIGYHSAGSLTSRATSSYVYHGCPNL